MHRHGVVAGSFDPITNGHLWLIREALSMVDELTVVVGVNPVKKYMFSADERQELVRGVLEAKLPPGDVSRVKTVFQENELLVNFAASVGATHIVRGLRNSEDFQAENLMMMVNRKQCPEIHHAYVITPPNLGEVSSSTVKSLVGLRDWDKVASRYCHPTVVEALRNKLVRVQ